MPLRFSILTAVRNGAQHLQTALESVLVQDYPAIEMLVMDAGSTDGTVEIIRRYEDRLAFWRSHPDSGISAALNEGISRAGGDIIGILNADDWYEPGILAAAAARFEADPALTVVACEGRVVRLQNGALDEIEYFRGPRLALAPDAIPSPNIRFFRRDWFLRHGGFLETFDDGMPLKIANDVELLLRLYISGARSAALARLGYTFLSHEGSLTLSGNAGDSQGRAVARKERRAIAERFLHWDDALPPGLCSWLKRLHARASAYLYFYARREKDRAAAREAWAQGLRHAGWWLPYETARLYLSGRYKKP